MSLLGLFGSGGLLDSKDSGGLLGKHFSPNMPLLMTGLGMMGGGWGGALPGLQAGMQHQRQAQGVKDWESVIGGMGGGQGAPQPPAAMPAVPSPAIPPPAFGPSPTSQAGGARGASEIQGGGGLDPTSRDLVVRTVLAESGGEGPEGMAAVTNVIRNRIAAGRYGGNTAAGVVKAPNQFEPWNTPEGRAKIASFNPDSVAYRSAAGIVDRIFGSGESDPTGGATHFFAPQLQSQLGRNAPAWATNPLATIGRHSFYAPEGKVGGGQAVTRGGGAPAPQAAGGRAVPSPEQQQAFVAGLDPEKRQALARLAAQNPAVASAIMTQMFRAQGTGEAFTLGENQVRYSPQGAVIARGPEKQEKPQEIWVPLTTPEQRTAFGIPADSKQAWQYNPITKKVQAEGSGGGQTVNVNTKQDTEYGKVRGKSYAEEAERIIKEGREAELKVAQYQRLDALLSDPNVYTGTGAESIQALKKAGSTLFGMEFKGGESAEAAQRIGRELALQMGKQMSGSLSNSDRAFLEALPPNIGDSAGGRKAIVALTIDGERRKQQIAELARAYERMNGQLDSGWDETLADWLQEHPLFTPERQKEIMGAAQATPQPPPSAGITQRAYNVQTGQYLIYDPAQKKWVPE